MLGQQPGGMWASSEGIHSAAITVQVNPARDTFAEVALTRVNDISMGDGVWGQIGIIQSVSNSVLKTLTLIDRRFFARK